MKILSTIVVLFFLLSYVSILGYQKSIAANVSQVHSYVLIHIPSGKIIDEKNIYQLSYLQPMGSIIKLFAIYVKSIGTDLDTVHQKYCVATTKEQRDNDLFNYSFCWLWKGHGNVNLIQAIAYSCNSYFYSFVSDIDFTNFIAALLFYEVTVHDDQKYKELSQEQKKAAMFGREDFIELYPLKVAYFIAQLYNNGKYMESGVSKNMSAFSQTFLSIIHQGMLGVYRFGTVSQYNHILDGESVFVKTGTAGRKENGVYYRNRLNSFCIAVYDETLVIYKLENPTQEKTAALFALTVLMKQKKKNTY